MTKLLGHQLETHIMRAALQVDARFHEKAKDDIRLSASEFRKAQDGSWASQQDVEKKIKKQRNKQY